MGDVDLDALARDLGFILKSEQKEAVKSLLRGRDVFGVLPTGFGKSLIYQLFVLAKNESPKAASSVEWPRIIVICPLREFPSSSSRERSTVITFASIGNV